MAGTPYTAPPNGDSWTDAHGQTGMGSIAIRYAAEGPPPEQASTISLSAGTSRSCVTAFTTDSGRPHDLRRTLDVATELDAIASGDPAKLRALIQVLREM